MGRWGAPWTRAPPAQVERAPRRNKMPDPAICSPERKAIMSLLKWARVFLVISIIAALFGFTGISAAAADIARILFYIFIAIFVVLLILGLTIFRA
jgi:uncharacterized membrane protein YtjA (UPF0391 family)